MYSYGSNSGKSDIKTTLNSNKIGNSNIGKKPLTTLTTNKYSKSELEDAKNSLKGLKGGIGGIGNNSNNNNIIDNNYRKQFKPDFSNTLNSKQTTMKKDDPDINIYVNNKEVTNSKLNFAKKYGGGSNNIGGYSNTNNNQTGNISSQSNRMGSYTNSKLNKQVNDNSNNKFTNEISSKNDSNYSNKININSNKINNNSKNTKMTYNEDYDNPIDNMIAQNTKSNFKEVLESKLREEEDVNDYDENGQQCNVCGRKFNENAYAKHAKICKKVFASKRKPFDSKKKRIIDNEHAELLKRAAKTQNNKVITKKKVPTWKKQSEELRSVAKIAKSGDTNIVIPSTVNDDYILCQFCSRKYNEQAYNKHLNFCKTKHKESQMKPKMNMSSKPNLNLKFTNKK